MWHRRTYLVLPNKETLVAIRDEIQKKIERKQQEIVDLERSFELQLASANAYIQALLDLMKTLPRDAEGSNPEQVLRQNSIMARTREAILGANGPLHITEILQALGRPVDSANKVSVAGSLANYVRKGEIFARPAPNTFGLIELGHHSTPAVATHPPEGFGKVKLKRAVQSEDATTLDPTTRRLKEVFAKEGEKKRAERMGFARDEGEDPTDGWEDMPR